MQPLPERPAIHSAPRFYVSERQPIRRSAVLLAMVMAVVVLFAVAYALRHNGHIRFRPDSDEVSRSSGGGASARSHDDENDDPNQIDTIVLSDPADAPAPARKGDYVSPVHPTLLVHLPRYGNQTGLIPDSPAGHLLYKWLAAFNQASAPALAEAVPTPASEEVVAAQMDLREQTGGFALLSAKEVQPGVLVFRLQSQKPPAFEVLGTLQVRAGSDPASVASFSLRGVEAAAGK
ncbi:hypothetical protein FTW19_03520 [Terriglobus albidus]|uniref:Uncharacterized protein n=1 Tax=Terriglobus albidus TaxID=1592106 RepID=A0A5B9E6D8_9BACT|nr:hypothetical protein [Terriglobus albidus]QEE27164.1 hypothetical protein FTW19_03520 [Terriglobus albidus]